MRVVFIHGAFSRDGAWWWAPTAALLDRSGIASTAVALPSCGEAGIAPTGAGPGLHEDGGGKSYTALAQATEAETQTSEHRVRTEAGRAKSVALEVELGPNRASEADFRPHRPAYGSPGANSQQDSPRVYGGSFERSVGPDGRLRGRARLTQSEGGIKPFLGLMGALRVRDTREVVFEGRLPAG